MGVPLLLQIAVRGIEFTYTLWAFHFEAQECGGIHELRDPEPKDGGAGDKIVVEANMRTLLVEDPSDNQPHR